MRQVTRAVIAALTLAALIVSNLGQAPADASPPAAQGTPATFRGTANGRDTSHTVELQPGLVVVRGRHAGGSNFQLSLVLPRPGKDLWLEYEESVGIFGEIGQYNGGAASKVPRAGVYTLALNASGSYEITIEQPPLARVAEPGVLDFSGNGHQVTPVVNMPSGARRITLTHDGQASYGPDGLVQVWLLDMQGNTVAGDVSGRLFNQYGPFEGTVELEVILDDPHIFHVNATGSWTLRVE